jgi:WD40 repeat protein
MKKCIIGVLLSFSFFTQIYGQEKMHLVIPQGHTSDVQCLLLSKDDRYLISGGADGMLNFYDLKQQKLLKAIPLISSFGRVDPRKLQFNAAQTKVLISGDWGIFVLDIETLACKVLFQKKGVIMSTFSPDGKYVYVATRNGGYQEGNTYFPIKNGAYQVDLASGKATSLFELEQKVEFTNVLAAKDGRTLYFCTALSVTKYDIALKKTTVVDIPNVYDVLPNGQLFAFNLVNEDKNLYSIVRYNPFTLEEVAKLTFTGNSSWFKYVIYRDWPPLDMLHWWNVDAKRHRLILSNKQEGVIYDYEKNSVAQLPKYSMPFATSVVPSNADPNKWFIGFGGSESTLDVRAYNVQNNLISEPMLKGGFESRFLSAAQHTNGFVCSPKVSDDLKYFNVTESGKQVKLFTWGSAKTSAKLLNSVGETATLSPDGKYITAANYFGYNMIADVYGSGQTAKKIFESKTTGNINTIDYSENGLIAYFNNRTIYIYDINKAAIIQKIATGGGDMVAHGDKYGVISADGKMVYAMYGFTNKTGVEMRFVAAFSVETGQATWRRRLPEECTLVQLSEDGKKLYACYGLTIEELEPATGNVVNTKKFKGFMESADGFYIYALSKNATKAYVLTIDGEACVYNTADQTQLYRFPTRLQEGIFLKNDSLMVTGTGSTLKIWDIYGRKELASIYVFKETSAYIVITPEGLFDGTEDAIRSIYFVEGKEVVPVESFYETYYTPNLLARILSRQKLPLVNDIRNLNPRPKARLNYAVKTRNLKVADDKQPDFTNTTGLAEIAIEASAENDRVDEVRLFHNGKIVNATNRNLVVADEKTGRVRRLYTVDLLPGINTFRGVALNGQRTESAPDEISINYLSSNTANTSVLPVVIQGDIDQIDKNATLHLLVIGINAYKNPNMRLNYALADATAFKEQMERGVQTVIKNVKTYFVTDDLANKQGIVSAFEAVQKVAKAQDVFMFYYAGHGVISEKNREFYLVPNDVADLKNIDESLASKGISAKFLQQYAVNIRAQKQLFILDACQSAGAFAKLIESDASQQKSLALVARSTGTHWMAASGSQQYAQEFSQLGHGAFTYALLSGLDGKAKVQNLITVNGLKNYINDIIPKLMKQYNGSEQFPVSYGFGKDFPVEELK